MTNIHQFSPCCGTVAHRHGDRRYRCPRCGRTWSRYPHKRGRKRHRGQQDLVKRVVFEGEQLTHQKKHYPLLSSSAIVHRFGLELTRLLIRPPAYPTSRDRYLLLVDALWFWFGDTQWTLYMLALKPQRQNVAILLEPVMLCGKEAARDWRVAIQTIPDQLISCIDGFISDDLAGLRKVASEYGWIHQLCQFHLIKEVYRRLGRRRPNHTPHRDLRERICVCSCGRTMTVLRPQLPHYISSLLILVVHPNCVKSFGLHLSRNTAIGHIDNIHISRCRSRRV